MGERNESNHQGTREATPEQINRVLRVLEDHRGEARAISRGEVCRLAGLDGQGRTLTAVCRAIDLDPDLPALGYDFTKGMLWLCATMREVERTTTYFHRFGTDYLERARARERKAARATAAQPLLFDLGMPV